MKIDNRVFLNKEVQQDEIFQENSIVDLQSLTGKPSRKGLEKAIICQGTIVNVVSKGYGHLPNDKLYLPVEQALIKADIKYDIRSINRDNRSFAVDYILKDDSYHVDVKNKKDKLVPMLRFVNSYDGSCKTSGYFGFYREICSNGLHMAESKVGFSVKHRGEITEIVLPEIDKLVEVFLNNEFYSLHKKFKVLSETPVSDIDKFVEMTLKDVHLFNYVKSEKNPAPSLNAQLVIDIINRESKLLNEDANLWLGYNAFNEVLHGKLKKTFEQQKELDGRLFETIMEYAN